MKVLLVGEYSNVHATLAKGLRLLGHSVVVVSDGDGWKDYVRDVDVVRRSTGLVDTLSFLGRLWVALRGMRGFDVVQLINPVFFELRAERLFPLYDYLRRVNRRMVLGAFGMDYYWLGVGMDCRSFRYSDFNLGCSLRRNADVDGFVSDWALGAKGRLNRYIAHDCDGIVSGLYEYDVAYRGAFPNKTCFIPFPLDLDDAKGARVRDPGGGVIRFFIGVQRGRDVYKGTDVMYDALLELGRKYPGRVEIVRAESVRFDRYVGMLDGCDVLLDQLYSYTPAMNALLAMAKGLVVVGGGEEEHYGLLGEERLRPVVNVRPDRGDVFACLERLVLHPEEIRRRSVEGMEYVRLHHDVCGVAGRYVSFWSGLGV